MVASALLAWRAVLARVLALQLGSSRSCCRRRGCVALDMLACRFGNSLGVKAEVGSRLRSEMGSFLL